MATYGNNSPWYKTQQNPLYLNIMEYRAIPLSKDDALYTIEVQYQHRPDLLAYDLYGDAKLWWVFVMRNRSILADPIFDFKPGISIFVPGKDQLFRALAT